MDVALLAAGERIDSADAWTTRGRARGGTAARHRRDHRAAAAGSAAGAASNELDGLRQLSQGESGRGRDSKLRPGRHAHSAREVRRRVAPGQENAVGQGGPLEGGTGRLKAARTWTRTRIIRPEAARVRRSLIAMPRPSSVENARTRIRETPTASSSRRAL